MLEKIKEKCFYISTLFGIGDWPFSYLIATLVSFPLLILGRFFYDLVPKHYFYWSIVFFIIIYYLIIFFALRFITEKDKSTIILNKTVGMIFVFIGIVLKTKFIVMGFILFHFIAFFAPFIYYKIFGRRVEMLPANFAPLFGDIVYGLCCNLFLRFLLWFSGF